MQESQTTTTSDDQAASTDVVRRGRDARSLLPPLLLFCLLSPLGVVNLEWHAYHQQLRLPDSVERSTLPLLWVLYVKNLLLLLPCLVPPLVLRGWFKTALVCSVGYIAALYFWLILDQQAYALTGSHLTDYVRFALAPNAFDWVGSPGEVLGQVLRYFVSLAQGALAVLIGCAGAAYVLYRLLPARRRRAAAAGLAAVYAAAVLGAMPAQLTYPDVTNLRRLNDAMPVSLSFLAPGVSFPDIRGFVEPFKRQTRQAAELAHRHVFPGAAIDEEARVAAVEGRERPNVIVLVVESFRAASVSNEVTPNLVRLGRDGLNLKRHYAGTNFTHLGLFSLLYGRSPALYYQTLTFNIPPQATTTLRKSGYRATYVCGVEHRGWCWMERYLNEGPQAFDRLMIGAATDDWPALDRTTLGQVRELVSRPGGQPQFVFAFLNSTHYPYKYPPEFLKFTPVWDRFDIDVLRIDPAKDGQSMRNHYHNSVAFLDEEIGRFVRSIDLTKNIVVITGDHGETFWEDGAIGHATKLSDAQTRVPCVILGPGVPVREVTDATSHADVLPTLLHAIGGQGVPLRYSTGNDLLGEPGEGGRLPPIFGTDGRLGLFKMLILGNDDRRLLIEFGKSRVTPDVLGSVDVAGGHDPFDVPAAQEAGEWAGVTNRIMSRLAGVETEKAAGR